MSLQRRLAWSTSMHQIRSSGPAAPGGAMASRALARLKADQALEVAARRPLYAGGKFDLSAIMQLALADARRQQMSGLPASWKKTLAMTLRSAWSQAKSQRLIAERAQRIAS